MRLTICLAAVTLAFATTTPVEAKPSKAPAFQLMETTWLFTDPKGVKVRESIDAKGNYISNSRGGKHLDHGTAVMKGEKACFTSAMYKEGEVCWTTKPVKVGQSMTTTSDKGEKLKVTRVKYMPLKMPK